MCCIWPLIFLGFCGCNDGRRRRCRPRCINDPFFRSRGRFDPGCRTREFDPDDRDEDRRRRGCGCDD